MVGELTEVCVLEAGREEAELAELDHRAEVGDSVITKELLPWPPS